MLCDFVGLDGEPLPICPRGILKRMVARLAEHGLTARVAPEIEFSVFEEPIQQARAQGYRELTPLGGESRVTYLLSRSQDLAEFMDAATRRLDALGIDWESWISETAGGQVEINLAPTDPLSCADGVARAKLALREVAADLGRTVTFMGLVDEHLGASMHVNLSLRRGRGERAGGSGRGRRRRAADAAVDRRPAGDDAGRDVVLQPERELVSPPGRDRRAADHGHVGARQQVGGAADRRPRPGVDEDRAPGAGDRLQPVPGPRGDPRRRADRDRGRARAAGAVSGDGLGPADGRGAPAAGVDHGGGGRAGAPTRASASCSAAEGVDYWLGSRRWEWIAFHRNGGDPDAVSDFELRRYFEHT